MSAISSTQRTRQPKLNFAQRFDKIIELLVYLAHRKPNRDQYQAVKLLYLADREHFNRYGRPITYGIYYAMDYGPVASTALDLIKGDKAALRKGGIERLPIRIEKRAIEKKRASIYTLVEAERAVDYDVFSKSDLRVFDEVVDRYGDKSFDELYHLTHEHFAYKVAWNHRGKQENRSLMFYEDMLDDSPVKSEVMEDLEPIAEFLR